ncbi:alpha/beta hydrolase [Enterococcus sp. JM4C]|uniref:alpha/beta fold hydrolase n=1 Tax=Candidatus Enterococcus huntleyi TaxID=1857217 RepID=UPI001379675E|nr:alpha/beta hydrolase [Enterococcus sp. JM4C]KAF1297370.1 alpha/beta hydrolase [Enterococcus sp. JM4C]
MEIIEQSIPSTNDKNQLKVKIWRPKKSIKAVFQIIHGMVEHIERYSEFAVYMASKGYLVVGHDHVGHGDSVTDESEYGHFGSKNGHQVLVKDVATIQQYFAAEYPNIPYFILGHSMGSLVLRNYLIQYPDVSLEGAILMGTAHEPLLKMRAAILASGLIVHVKGAEYPSKLIDQLAFGGYNKRFEPARTPKDWLTRDEEMVDLYLDDAKTQFMFSVKAYQDLFILTKNASNPALLKRINDNLPIYLISGAQDPVGGFGKNVTKLYEQLQSANKQVTMTLVKNGRHEILNEMNAYEVYQMVLNWVEKR